MNDSTTLLHSIIVENWRKGHDVLPSGNNPRELRQRRECLDVLRIDDQSVPPQLYIDLFSELELRQPWPEPPDDEHPQGLRLRFAA